MQRIADVLPDPAKPRFEVKRVHLGAGREPEWTHSMWCPRCQRWHTTTTDRTCPRGHDVLAPVTLLKGWLPMVDSLLQRLERSGVQVTRSGALRVDGVVTTLPDPPALALAERYAALKARLIKGGDWIDTEHAWLTAHVHLSGTPTYDQREAELDRQLQRYCALLEELGGIEHQMEGRSA